LPLEPRATRIADSLAGRGGTARGKPAEGLSLREAMRALKRAGIEFVSGYRGGVYHVATYARLLEQQWKERGGKPEPRKSIRA